VTDDRTPEHGRENATPDDGAPEPGSGMADLDRVLDRRQRDPDEVPPPPPPADEDLASGRSEADPGSDGEPGTAALESATAPSPDVPEDAEGTAAGSAATRDEDVTETTVIAPEEAPATDAAAGASAPPSATADPDATSHQEDPMAAFAPETDRPRRGRRAALVTLLVVVVLAAAYGAAAWFLGDRVPTGATVAGVPIGGMSGNEAVDRLERELGPVAEEQVPVTVGEGVSSIDPASTGLRFDAETTVDDLVGFTLDPRVLWGRAFGLGAVDPVTEHDEAALREAVQSSATELDVAPVEGAIAFSGTTPEVTEPEPGTAVDVDAATEQIAEGWLTEERPIELSTEEVAPDVGPDAVETALTEQAEPLVSGSVTVEVGDQLAELGPDQLASHATFEARDGALELRLDGEGLADEVTEVNPDIETAGEDARIVLGSDGPEIRPSSTGAGLDPDQLARAVKQAGTSGERTAEVELVESEPEFTTEDAEELGVNEVISEFSTPMPYNPVRTTNLQVGADKASGTLIMPGEEFSLLDVIGPISAANGYVSSGVVEDGFESEAVGGGLSQLSTTLYNVAFLAGMDDVEHTPHSRWFDRYPQGREATLWEPSIDMVWRNNTDYGVLVEAWVSSDRVHARLWGTDVWDVQTSTSDPYNIVSPQTVYNPSPECVPESGGQNGFSVTVTRTRSRDGEVVDEESWNWTYSPWNHVVCGSPPSSGGGGDGDDSGGDGGGTGDGNGGNGGGNGDGGG